MSPLPGSSGIILPGQFQPGLLAVDARLNHPAWPEHQHRARQDRNLDAGLRVAADPAALLADGKRSEPADLHGISRLKRRGQAREDPLEKLRGFVPGETDLRIDGLGEVSPGDGTHVRNVSKRARHVN